MCPFCLYNKKHDNVAVWQKDFGTFCFSCEFLSPVVFPFLEDGNRNKNAFKSII